MTLPTRLRRPALCALTIAATCGASAVAASPASAAPQRVKYLERRLQVARTDLADAQAKLVARYEHRVAVKQALIEAGRACPHALSEARAADCESHASGVLEGLEQELALAREGKQPRPYVAALERRIARLEQELASAKAAGPAPARVRLSH
jgi:hypothetical protein